MGTLLTQTDSFGADLRRPDGRDHSKFLRLCRELLEPWERPRNTGWGYYAVERQIPRGLSLVTSSAASIPVR
jgi:hypothetical protein